MADGSSQDQRADGPFSFPNPFPCSFVPRDKRARELILADTMAC